MKIKIINRNRTNWSNTNKRFVCFMDILGFKELVSRSPHEEIYLKMMEINKAIRNITDKIYSDIYIATFSDSIVMFTKTDTREELYALIKISGHLFSKCINNLLPIKGAIAYGNISINKNQQIYFGQPIIDAYLLEEDLQYYGIVFHDSIDKYLEDNDISFDKEIYFECKTHLKTGKITHNNLNWFSWIIDSQTKKSNKEICMVSINKMKSICSGYPRKYVDNTIEFINENY